MDVQIHPTSPKLRGDKNSSVAKVWSEPNMMKPHRTPWMGIIVMIIIMDVLTAAALLFGWGWISRNAPHTRFLRWLPSFSTTTIVQQTQTPSPNDLPSSVKNRLDDQVGLAVDQGTAGVYSEPNISGRAIPLSSAGWMVTVTEAMPSKSPVAIVQSGRQASVTTTLVDPFTPMTFLKIDQLDTSPATLSSDAPHVGQRVWVMTGSFRSPVASSRLIVGSVQPAWRSTDRAETYWQLDAPVEAVLGTAILNENGEVVGLLGANSRVWPVDQLKPVLNAVLQHSQVLRPHFGFKFLMLSDAITQNENGNVGALVGADVGDASIEAKGPADKAGLKSGDVITSIDQHVLQTDLVKVLSTYQPGDIVHLSVQRGEKVLQLNLTVGSQRS